MENFNTTPKIIIMVSDTLLTYTNGKLNEKAMERITFLLANMHNSGMHVALVSAGAIALGSEKLQMQERPQSLSEKQAIAAIGQVEMMKAYQISFNDYNQIVAQVLITRNVVLNEDRNERVTNTINSLFEMGIIPIINENDSVSTADIELEDNYPLTSDIAHLVNADIIVITSDTLGRYNILQKNNCAAEVVNTESELYLKLDKILSSQKSKKNEASNFPKSMHEVQFLEN